MQCSVFSVQTEKGAQDLFSRSCFKFKRVSERKFTRELRQWSCAAASLHALWCKVQDDVKVVRQPAGQRIIFFNLWAFRLPLLWKWKVGRGLCRASIFAVYMLQPLWWMNRASSLMPTWGCIYLIIFYEIFAKVCTHVMLQIVFSICVRISNALTLNYRIVTSLHGIVPLLDCFPKTSLFCVLDVGTVLNSRIWCNK